MADDNPISDDLLKFAHSPPSSERYGGLKRALADLSATAALPRQGDSEDEERYELIEEIARGGVGIVFRARDRQLGRTVALKKLNPDFANRPQMVERFVEEAQIGGQLQHPGVVPVHEVGRDADGHPFFAMKLVAGRTFGEILAEGRTARPELLRIFERICQTVAYAHDRGIIHRDLKPANIMVGAFGEVQVMDWGLAKVVDRPEGTTLGDTVATVRTESDSALSRAGTVMGTPAYMPPEQAQGEIDRVDRRSDVFSLGAVLCELLTGQPPYIGDTSGAIMDMAMASDLDDAKRRINHTDADPAIKTLALACLEPIPANRPQAAVGVADALADYLAAVEERARAAQIAAARARARTLAAVIALVALVAGAVGYVAWEADRKNRTRSVLANIAEARREAEQRATVADRAPPRDPGQWAAVNAIADRAAVIARSDLLTDDQRDEVGAWRRSIAARADRAEAVAAGLRRDDAMKGDLERFEHGLGTPQGFDDTYRGYGIDLSRPPETNAQLIARSSIADDLVHGLDDWLLGSPERGELPPQSDRILHLLAVADRDPKRARLRSTLLSKDQDALTAIAAGLDGQRDDVRTIVLAARYFRRAAGCKEGIELLLRAYPYHTGDYNLLNELVRQLRLLHEYEGARPYVCALLALRPGHAPTLSIDARLHCELQEWDLAERSATRAVAMSPDLADPYHVMFLIANHRNEHVTAITRLTEALERRPGSMRWWHELGLTHLRKGEYAKAIAAYRRALQLSERFVMARYELAVCLQKSGKVEPAVAQYERAVVDGEAELRMPERTKSHAASYDVEKFIVESHRQAGVVLTSLGRLGRANHHFDKMIARRPEITDAYQLAAHNCLSLGDYPSALRFIERGIEADPDDHLLHSDLGSIYSRVGHVERATQAFKKSLSLEPTRAVYGNLVALHLMGGRIPEAEAVRAEAREDGFSLASVATQMRTTKQASAALERVVAGERQIDRPVALLLFGSICSARGHHRQAVDFYERALAQRDTTDPRRTYDDLLSAAIAAARAADAVPAGPDRSVERADYVEQTATWIEDAAEALTPLRESARPRHRYDGTTRLGVLRHHAAFESLFAKPPKRPRAEWQAKARALQTKLDRMLAKDAAHATKSETAGARK